MRISAIRSGLSNCTTARASKSFVVKRGSEPRTNSDKAERAIRGNAVSCHDSSRALILAIKRRSLEPVHSVNPDMRPDGGRSVPRTAPGPPDSACSMLNHSFIHLPGIDSTLEERLWGRGVTTWDLLENDRAAGASELRDAISISRERLAARDAAYFAERMPAHESWRLYAEFYAETAFLDIETTGLGGDAYTTVCGVLDRTGFSAFSRGDEMDMLPEYLEQFRLIVTFNGRSFDVPFLRRELGASLLRGAAHMDLMHVLRKLGLKGGLKGIEKALGVGRPSSLSTLDGRDAVTLWAMSQEGEGEALETLIRYNAEDVLVLPRLAAIAVRDHSAGTPMAGYIVDDFPEPDISVLPFDSSIVHYLASRRGKIASYAP